MKEYSEEIPGEYQWVFGEYEWVLGECQCGFRQQRSTTDQLFVVRQILENLYAQDIDLHLLFTDFKKASDSIKKSARISSEFWDTQKDRTAREFT